MLKPRFRYSLIGSLILGAIALNACHESREPAQEANSTVGSAPVQNGQLTNYGDPALARFANKLAASQQQKVHIVQIGDSHTAADFFTGELRTLLQKQYGDGGVGFISPLGIPGNRIANATFEKSSGWSLITSRKESSPDFTFGGAIATAENVENHASFALRDTRPAALVQALYRSQQPTTLTLNGQPQQLEASAGSWHFSPPVRAVSPMQFSLDPAGTQLAGWFVTQPGGGVMVTASGINGAQASMADKWQPEWIEVLQQLKPDMVILAFGTNEAFNSDLELASYRASLQKQMQTLRQALPDTVLLLVGPGSSIMNRNAANCSTRQPALLPAVIDIQRQVAQQEHALFWDWFAWMGGDCAIEGLADRGLSRDKIHLTQPGYQRSAEALWQQLSAVLRSQ